MRTYELLESDVVWKRVVIYLHASFKMTNIEEIRVVIKGVKTREKDVVMCMMSIVKVDIIVCSVAVKVVERV